MIKYNIYIDCTDLIETDLNTGIQRVARNLVDNRLSAQQKFCITCQQVYFNTQYGFIKVSGYQKDDIRKSIGFLYSVRFCLCKFLHFKTLAKTILYFPKFQKWLDRYWQGTNRFLLMWPIFLIISPVILISLIYTTIIPLKNYWEPSKDDILIIPGKSWWTCNLENGISKVKANQGHVVTIIYDLIPLTHPYFFTKSIVEKFTSKIPFTSTNTDLFVAISQTTENVLKEYLITKKTLKDKSTKHFLLGADLDLIDQTLNIRKSLKTLFSICKPYLCVGTIEPRKNHTLLLDAFDKIWEKNREVYLCIVGCYGWNSEILKERINNHPLFGYNLKWFTDLNDNELIYSYKNAKALIYPSIIEGFGLPLIESLHYGCPVMASDIPVFREIGSNKCSYFTIDSPDSLVSQLIEFESSGKLAGVESIDEFNWISWEDSTLKFYEIIKSHFENYENRTTH